MFRPIRLLKPVALLLLVISVIVASTPWALDAVAQSAGPCGTSTVDDEVSIPPLRDDPTPANGGDIESTLMGATLPGRPTDIVFGPDGSLYVSVIYSTTYPLDYFASLYGSVFQLTDGRANLLIDGLKNPTGLTFLDNDLYIAELDAVVRVSSVQGTSCASVDRVVTNLPFDESHWTNGVTAHDGRIYATTGWVYRPLPTSRLNVRGTVFSFAPDGSDLRIEATGLRNSYALAFDDEGRIWASDNGPNVDYDPGVKDESQVFADDLNMIEPGGDYGFHPGTGSTKTAGAKATPVADPCMAADCGTPPMATLEMHSAPTGVAWNDEIHQVLVTLSAWGQVRAYNPVSGAQTVLFWGLNLPSGIEIGPDGALYVAEWGANRVIRIEFPETLPPAMDATPVTGSIPEVHQ